MYFRKNIEPKCSYCQFATNLFDDDTFCAKYGVVKCTDHCNFFRYDPLKRTPAKPVQIDTSKFSDQDFSL